MKKVFILSLAILATFQCFGSNLSNGIAFEKKIVKTLKKHPISIASTAIILAGLYCIYKHYYTKLNKVNNDIHLHDKDCEFYGKFVYDDDELEKFYGRFIYDDDEESEFYDELDKPTVLCHPDLPGIALINLGITKSYLLADFKTKRAVKITAIDAKIFMKFFKKDQKLSSPD
ncbi:MAG TPA: hypothetical protein QGF02_02245 [Candidatus Babeliales bacterium]|nr:hypothetical protein [Candidatus Babeliales bacterium]